MRINDLEELNGCVRDNIPCKFLFGSLELKPYIIFCSIGQECCRGHCVFHLDNEKGLTMEEMIKDELK